ncbi:hypothetical protein U1Q18_018143 [Sarracenia purpurea var. burkii]
MDEECGTKGTPHKITYHVLRPREGKAVPNNESLYAKECNPCPQTIPSSKPSISGLPPSPDQPENIHATSLKFEANQVVCSNIEYLSMQTNAAKSKVAELNKEAQEAPQASPSTVPCEGNVPTKEAEINKEAQEVPTLETIKSLEKEA